MRESVWRHFFHKLTCPGGSKVYITFVCGERSCSKDFIFSFHGYMSTDSVGGEVWPSCVMNGCISLFLLLMDKFAVKVGLNQSSCTVREVI